ncbi:hypothetical protein GR28A_00060 [Vibrio phage vB_VcorM_GR28A]|nr:hypothetical protein GR28A_00060 [Vibrio phage vB_VcorM_GR28A]
MYIQPDSKVELVTAPLNAGAAMSAFKAALIADSPIVVDVGRADMTHSGVARELIQLVHTRSGAWSITIDMLACESALCRKVEDLYIPAEGCVDVVRTLNQYGGGADLITVILGEVSIADLKAVLDCYDGFTPTVVVTDLGGEHGAR